MTAVFGVGIEREVETSSYTLNTALGSTPEIPYYKHAGGTIHWLSTSSHTLFTFYTAHTEGGAYHAVQDKNNAAVTRTVSNAANESMAIPDECFGVPFIKITSDDDGGVVTISFKS